MSARDVQRRNVAEKTDRITLDKTPPPPHTHADRPAHAHARTHARTMSALQEQDTTNIDHKMFRKRFLMFFYLIKIIIIHVYINI